jgi:DNA-binding MarR family transcriptional regulator
VTASERRRPGVGAGWTTFLITQLGSLAATRYAERLGPLDLNPAHTGVLRAIAATPGSSQQLVAAQLGLLPSRMVTLVDELEDRRLVERRRNAEDRRHYALYVTDAGEASLQDIGQLAQQHGKEFLAALNRDEQTALAGLLERLAEHHGLTPGVHPGYSQLGRGGDAGSGPGGAARRSE